MFHYFITMYITCTSFLKFIENEYTRPYFFIARCFYDFHINTLCKVTHECEIVDSNGWNVVIDNLHSLILFYSIY